MTKAIAALLVLVCVLFSWPLWAAEPLVTLKRSNPERKMILDALRVTVQKELKKPVTFRVDSLKAQDGWAFLRGVPLGPRGTPINYCGTTYQKAIKAGIFDNWICALLQKRRGRWRVVTHVIGATDMPYENWAQHYHAPPAIFQ